MGAAAWAPGGALRGRMPLRARPTPAAVAGWPLGLLFLVGVGWAIASGGQGPLVVAAAAVLAVTASRLVRFERVVALLIFLSPFYFVLKQLLPPPLNGIWWSGLIVVVFVVSALRFGVGEHSRFGIVQWLGLAFVVWGALEVLVGPSLGYGVNGFRVLFVPLLLLFPLAQGLRDERVATLYLRAAILGGLMVAAQCVLQFALINGHLVGIGSWLDSGRSLYMAAHKGFAPSARFGLQRSLGPYPDPGQTGLFLAAVAAMLLPVAFGPAHRRVRGARLATAWIALGLLTTLSTWPMVVTLVIGALAVLIPRPAVARVDRLLLLAVILGIGAILWKATGGPTLPRDPLLARAQSYSIQTVEQNTSNLREALERFDLVGGGLFVAPSRVSSSPLPEGEVSLGRAYFFLDDLVTQVGLVGILLLLLLWVAAISRSYRAIRRSSPGANVVAVITWSGLVALLAVSQHYGAPLVYGPNLLLVLLLALSVRLERFANTSPSSDQ